MSCWKLHQKVLLGIALGVFPTAHLQAQCTLPDFWPTRALAQLSDNAQGVMSAVLVANLKHEGFSCTDHGGSAAGYLCTSPAGYFPGYPKRVSLVISKKLTSVSHYDLHLHGWFLHGATYESTLKDFDFENRFSAAGKNNSIMIVPESENHSKSFVSYFSKPGALDSMVQKVNTLVGRSDADIRSISLSGHSGAQVPLSIILRDCQRSSYGKKIDTVLLFDATYSDKTVFKPELEKNPAYPPGTYQYDSMVQFAKWIESGTNRTLVSTYVETSTTGPESIKLKNTTSLPSTNRLEVIGYVPKPVPTGIDSTSFNHFQICYDQMTDFFKNYTVH